MCQIEIKERRDDDPKHIISGSGKISVEYSTGSASSSIIITPPAVRRSVKGIEGER